MTQTGITIAPVLAWPLLVLVGLWAIAELARMVAARRQPRRMAAAGLRCLAVLVVLLALLQPRRLEETARPLPDRLILLVDRSASMGIGQREAMAEEATRRLTEAGRRLGLQVETAAFDDRDRAAGDALRQARLAGDDRALAAVVLVTDGLVQDPAQLARALPAGRPLHLLLAGDPGMRDRRLVIESAPPYAVVGRPVTIRLRVEDHGSPPAQGEVPLVIADQDGNRRERLVPVGRSVTISHTPHRRGTSWLSLAVATAPGEAVTANNRRTLRIEAVRDRLRVLLISGEPHPGERAWREILKSDPAVDLVHFTILRLVESQDPARPEELSLIPFPTDRLFGKQLSGFDLVIFDRYRLRGVLQPSHLDAIRRYVRDGGSLFVASGPEFAGPGSLAKSPLADLLPALPAGAPQELAFRPRLTAEGRRHPVTRPLIDAGGKEGTSRWGHWYRYLPVRQRRGVAVLAGPQDGPLLLLADAGKGRIAMLQSDQFWLWARDIAGGGPYVPLLRRSLHWLMREPDLEAERLTARIDEKGRLLVTRRSLKPGPRRVTVTASDGTTFEKRLTIGETGEGRLVLTGLAPGRYRLRSDELASLAIVPDPDAREHDEVVPTAGRLSTLATGSGGAVHWLKNGPPQLVHGTAQNGQSKDGAFAIPRRDARVVTASRMQPLLPLWLPPLAALLCLLAAWWLERAPERKRTSQSAGDQGHNANRSGSAGASATSGR